MDSFIAGEYALDIWVFLFAITALALWAETTRWGRKVGAAVIALLLGFILGNANILPAQAPVYEFVWGALVPLAIPMLLYQANIRKIIRESGPTLFAFLIGLGGTVAGALAGYLLIPLPERAADLTGIFAATYIGGGMNFVAVSNSVGMPPGDLLMASAAADNIVTIAYLLVLALLPAIGFFRKGYPAGDPPDFGIDEAARPKKRIKDYALVLSGLALSLVIVLTGFALERLIAISGSAILFATLIAVLFATTAPGIAGRLTGAFDFGMVLMYIFFASLGASANVSVMVDTAPVIFLFAIVIVAVHALVLFGAGKFTRFTLPELITASNACVLGAATAAGLAATRGWKNLVTPGILVGTLGYAIATFIGVGLAGLLS